MESNKVLTCVPHLSQEEEVFCVVCDGCCIFGRRAADCDGDYVGIKPIGILFADLIINGC